MATLYLTPFSKDDPRLKHSLEVVEPKIHFALNCGAKSCPPIKTFTSSDIDQELKTATESYLENDDAIKIDGNVVHLSMLFNWYSSDFGNGKIEILRWISDQFEAGAEKKLKLEELLKAPEGIKVKNITYDWGHNEKD